VSVPDEAVNFVVIRYEQEVTVVCQDLVVLIADDPSFIALFAEVKVLNDREVRG
jgi:hypothetical protein